MQRVKRTTAVAVLPADPAGGTPGYFANPNPGGGVPATVPGYEWYNNIQEEVMAVIEGQSLAPSGSDRTQLRQAIAKMITSAARAVVIDAVTFNAGVANGHAVYWDSANTRFDKAIANGTAAQNCVGFADVTNSKLYAFGDAVLFSGLTPGSRYYLDGTTAGAITTTAPTNAVFVGVAKSATEVFVDIDATGGTAFASGAENAAGTIENKAVDPLGIREAFNATGSAPVYACRAWVNFNGTGTPTIRASGNVSSITDNGTGDYTVNFTTAMQDANYAIAGGGVDTGSGELVGLGTYAGPGYTVAAGSVRVGCRDGSSANRDPHHVWVSIFR